MDSAQFAPWKRMKLRRKFIVVATMFTVVLAGLIAYTASAVNQQKDKLFISEVAGRQRMLVQKYTEEVLMAAQGQAADHAGTMAQMREALSVLENGGSAQIGGDGGMRVWVNASEDGEFRAKLGEQGNLLRQLESEAGRYLSMAANDSRRAEKMREVLALQTQLTNQADLSMKVLVREVERHINLTVTILTMLGIGAALGGMGISWIIGREIVDPLASCAYAALEIAKGNLRLEPQRITSADEIGQLQESFNEMLSSLREIALQSRSVCESLTIAASQILSSTQSQAAGTKQQAAAVQEITTRWNRSTCRPSRWRNVRVRWPGPPTRWRSRAMPACRRCMKPLSAWKPSASRRKTSPRTSSRFPNAPRRWARSSPPSTKSPSNPTWWR